MDRFFASLKKELVHDADFATRVEARAAIFEYIEVFFNNQRRHSALDTCPLRSSSIHLRLNSVSTFRGDFHCPRSRASLGYALRFVPQQRCVDLTIATASESFVPTAPLASDRIAAASR